MTKTESTLAELERERLADDIEALEKVVRSIHGATEEQKERLRKMYGRMWREHEIRLIRVV